MLGKAKRPSFSALIVLSAGAAGACVAAFADDAKNAGCRSMPATVKGTLLNKCQDPNGSTIYYVNSEAAEKAKVEDERARAAANAAKRARARQIEMAIQQHRVLVGMTREQVLRAVGKPSAITTATSSTGESEILEYRSNREASHVHVENGVVTSILRRTTE